MVDAKAHHYQQPTRNLASIKDVARPDEIAAWGMSLHIASIEVTHNNEVRVTCKRHPEEHVVSCCLYDLAIADWCQQASLI